VAIQLTGRLLVLASAIEQGLRNVYFSDNPILADPAIVGVQPLHQDPGNPNRPLNCCTSIWYFSLCQRRQCRCGQLTWPLHGPD